MTLLMPRLLLLSAFLLTINTLSNGQDDCIVTLDKDKGLVTTCMIPHWDATQTYITETTKHVFKGNPYFSYPVWESGSVWVEGQRQALNGKVAYNLNRKKVYYGVDSTHFYVVQPDQFTLNNLTFINRSVRVMGETYSDYYQVLYNGKAVTLLQQTTCKLSGGNIAEGYSGSYTRKEAYFIQNESGLPKLIKLTRKSVEKALSGRVKSGGSPLSLPLGELSVETIIDYLKSLN
jgi:hypothetical protein